MLGPVDKSSNHGLKNARWLLTKFIEWLTITSLSQRRSIRLYELWVKLKHLRFPRVLVSERAPYSSTILIDLQILHDGGILYESGNVAYDLHHDVVFFVRLTSAFILVVEWLC